MTGRWPRVTAGPTTPQRVTDIEFDDAVADPIGQVARVYDAVGLPLTPEAETAMRRWLDDRPREAARPGYDLAIYGLSRRASRRAIRRCITSDFDKESDS